MRIFGTVEILSFDAAGYTAELKAALEENFKDAARAFLRAAIPLIPVQTGMARGSFLNVGRFLREAVPISPTRFNQKYRNTGSLKSQQLGADLSTKPADLFDFSNPNKLVFEFQSKVFHLNILDIGLVRGRGQWGSFEAGRNAFMKKMIDLRTNLPILGEFMTKTTITYGRGVVLKDTDPIRIRRQRRTK